MRALVQRVVKSSVIVEGDELSSIDKGLLLFLGIHKQDTNQDVDWMIRKILNLRIFEDENGKMGKSVQDISGELMIVSQVTLYGDLRSGNRPDLSESMRPEKAQELFEAFVKKLKESSPLRVEQGKFAAEMEVRLVNDGPVTIWIDSKEK